MENGDDIELEGGKIPKFTVKVSHEAKLKELLRNLTSIEVKLCSDASKDFIKLLKGDAGGGLLCEYVLTSSKCSELLQAWKVRQGKPGLSYILSLISAILSHPDGKYEPNNVERITLSRALDKFAHTIIEEKLEDIYKELNSKEAKQQNAALLLLGSIVRRGSGLASDVAKSFDFKLPIFPKLAEYNKKQLEMKRKHSTRRSFIGFSMSFLEMGKPGLLRWVLQQKEMYSGVLRGLRNDDDETIVYVLSTLRDRILTPDSMVPPGLRSVLFGSVTLDQLINISGRGSGGIAVDTAHSVLSMVCTDPSNGLMPDLKRHPNPLRGNTKRLLDVMKKLKAADVDYHRYLLLGIVSGRASFGSAYLDEFPYNLEDHASPIWLAAVSLAANLVSSVRTGLSFGFLDSHTQNALSFENADVQSIIKCVGPRPFTRLVINKGLLHSDFLVKHGTLRLLLEALKLLDSFIGAIECRYSSSTQTMHTLASLKQDIQNEVRIFLPDPQVLLSLLSSLNGYYKTLDSSLKRAADLETPLDYNVASMKKLKTDDPNTDVDILVSGISSSPTSTLPESSVVLGTDDVVEWDRNDHVKVVEEIWGLHQHSQLAVELKDSETHFHSKLLDAFKIYHRTMPTVLKESFDFFKVFPADPLSLPPILQQSLLSLLIEHIGWSPGFGTPTKTPPLMYKHLCPFINLLLYSPTRDIKDQAHVLAKVAMLSTGAFDKTPWEIDTWFLFIPGYDFVEDEGVEVFQQLSPVIVSFLCDAVSTVGNNLFRYWDLLRDHTNQLKGFEDRSPEFSPLVICVIEKCLRLLSSESGTFALPEKTMISLYACNTIRYLLQTQVEAGLLSSLIIKMCSERFGDCCSLVDVYGDLCEWRPLRNLVLLSRSICSKQTCTISSIDKKTSHPDSSFVSTLGEVKRIVRNGHGGGSIELIKAFSFSMVCTSPAEILHNFPSILSVSRNFHGVPLSLLFSIFSLEQSFLGDVAKLWPELFFNGLSSFQEEIICTRDVDDSEHSASVAFSFFLKQAPFYVLFPAIIGIATPYLLEHTKLQDLLVAKLSNLTNDQFIFSLRLVLFWIHQIRSCYRIEPLGELEQRSEICFLLVERMLAQLFLLKPGSLTTYNIHEVVETILCHPTITESLECPLGNCNEFGETIFENSLENFLGLTWHGVHKMDHHVLNLLTTACDHLLAYSDSQESTYEVDECANKQIVKIFKALIQRLFSMYKDLFGPWIRTKNVGSIVPTLHALLTLIRFISPLELLHLGHWMFCTIDMTESTDTPSKSSLAVGLHIAGVAFEMLSAYFHRKCRKEVANDLFWRLEEKSFDGDLFEEIYFRVSEIATRFELDGADICLLRAANAAYNCKYVSHQCVLFGIVMSRVIVRTPINVLSHCIHKVNMTKAKLLFFLTEMSPLHLSVFGRLFSDMINIYTLSKGNVIEELGVSLSDEHFMMLMPVALSYLNSTSIKFGDHYKHFKNTTSFYMRIILDGFVNWKSYVSKDIFEVDYGEFLPSSAEELLNLFNGSLLGKSIRMLQYCFALSGNSVKLKKRLKIFDSICSPNSAYDELLDCDFDTVKAYSLNQSLNFVNRVVAKISFCRKLLFLEDDDQEGERDTKEISLIVGSNKEDLSRTRFLNILVRAWQLLVKNFPLTCDDSEELKSRDCLVFKILEDHILRNIYELTTKMLNGLIQLQSLPFLEQLVRSTLLHRFDNPMTLKILRGILISLSSGKFSCILFLQLLIAHSQFAPAIHSLSRSSGCSQVGVIFRPMSGFLRSLVFPRANRTTDDGQINAQVLEVIKLLRTLFHFTAKQSVLDSEKDIGINSKELLLLLLSSYGATLSDIDLEIYNLMHEIESIDESNSGNIDEMDYLWGSAALKVRTEREHGQGVSSDGTGDNKAGDEWRRSQFRENIPIDPKLCAATVLYFPYYRAVCDGNLCFNKIQQDNSEDTLQKHFGNVEKVQMYDPVFILRFSIRSLSMGYIEPTEFASFGLLAVAFVSISSPDIEMRKLGYEALGRFKTALEKCQRRKDVVRLKLLLTYLQNSVEEPWQRIPSITAIFIAEASFILLDTSHDHYSAINKLLTRSPGVNMKCVPLFHDFFWSSSVHFKTDRLWVLRLLYAGLNLEDDAQVYIRNSIFETLLSFYASPLADNESQDLILQIVKKSIKLHKMARYLVEHCTLISWLSTVISFFCATQWQDQKSSPLTRLNVVLEIVGDLISSRNTIEWLQRYALEQLSELSSHVYKLLAGGIKLRKENVDLAIRILQTLVSTLKISQKRKMFQPHFTLSVEGLFHLYQAINVCDEATYSPIAEFGLRAVLMSNPPVTIFHMDPEKLLKLIVWASLTALQSDSKRALQQKELHHCSSTLFEEEHSEDSLVSKLLRWLTASVIHGRISSKSDDGYSNNFIERSELKTLQSFVKHLENGCLENNGSSFGSEEILATTIFYLQQLLGMNCSVLPSVLSALSLLLLSGGSRLTGLDFSLGDEYPVAPLWKRIRCPVEANPAWRWSFYQPWKDLNASLSDSEKMDEIHACQTLLVIFANLLGKKRLDFQFLSHQELENSGVFKWERSILEAEL